MPQFKFDIPKIEKQILSGLLDKMNISLNVLKASIDAKTPEDSKTLI
jgi:hypothetical protein